MHTLLTFFLLTFLLQNSVNSLTCYDCPLGAPQPCTKTCIGALSCAYQINLPLQAINQQVLRCDNTVTQQGCVGNMETQSVTCFCTTEMCNNNLNVTGLNPPLGLPGQSTTTPHPFGIPAFGQPINNNLPGLSTPQQPGIFPPNGLPNIGTPQQPGIFPQNGLPNIGAPQQPGLPNNNNLPIGRKRRDADVSTTVGTKLGNSTDEDVSNNTTKAKPNSASKIKLSSAVIMAFLYSLFYFI